MSREDDAVGWSWQQIIAYGICALACGFLLGIISVKAVHECPARGPACTDMAFVLSAAWQSAVRCENGARLEPMSGGSFSCRCPRDAGTDAPR